MLQDDLAIKYKYKKLPPELSIKVQEKYLNDLPSALSVNGNANFHLYTKENTLIATGYDRIVVGDYGAFIECNRSQIVNDNIIIKKGQEFRLNNKYNVKYIWLTAIDDTDIKIYYQIRTVDYADYKLKMFYINPLEIKI
jgi:hypothetical protein